MAILKIFVCLASLIALYSQADTVKMDKEETINGVMLQSGKVNSVRTFKGQIVKTMNFPLEIIKKGIVNFDEKCNNDFKSKRKYTDKTTECKYHNENLVESFVIRDIKPGWSKEPGELDRYVIGRQVYNRGSFGYYEIIKVYEGVNSKNQKTVRIVQEMMDNKETKNYINPKFDRESAFDKSMGAFTLTQIGPKQTDLRYDYKSSTTHWILNKEVSIPQIFATISKSINDLVVTIDEESSIQTRKLASNNQ